MAVRPSHRRHPYEGLARRHPAEVSVQPVWLLGGALLVAALAGVAFPLLRSLIGG